MIDLAKWENLSMLEKLEAFKVIRSLGIDDALTKEDKLLFAELLFSKHNFKEEN